MMFILDLLNKIKWDKRENPKEYTLFYFDRLSNSNKELKFDDIKEIDKLFILIEVENKVFDLPVHRIREVRKGNEIVWKREPGEIAESEESIYFSKT